MKFVRGKVPQHVVKIHGSARAFKKLKREQLRKALAAVSELRTGCAFFPCGNPPVERVERALEEIEHAISVKVWGR